MFFIIAVCVFAASDVLAQGKRLVVLHTNDAHSTIMPLNPNLQDKELAGRGGFIRRLEFLQQHGNHEFDYGMDNMARVFKMANFPIVCANYDFTGTPLEGVVKPYVIIKRNGVKIGVFGLSPQPEGLVEKRNYPGMTFLDPVKKALEVATLLKKKKKCDMVICISHLGWNTDQDDDIEMIQSSRYIDLVLGGHTHTYFEELKFVKDLDGHDVAVDQNGKHAIWVGKMVVELSK